MSTQKNTIKDAIISVLESNGGDPLHYDEIEDMINRNGLYKKEISTKSIKVTLSRDTEFLHVKKGTYKLNASSTNKVLLNNFISDSCEFAYDVITPIDELYQLFKIWKAKEKHVVNISKDDFIQGLREKGINVYRIDPKLDCFNCNLNKYVDQSIDDDGLITVSSRIIPKSDFDFKVPNGLKNRVSHEIENSTDEQLLTDTYKDEWNKQRIKIYVTETLRENFKTIDCSYFSCGIRKIYGILNDWLNEPFASDVLHKTGYPKNLVVIFGTKEEVITNRKKLKDVDPHIPSPEMNQLKLELVNLISSNDICKNINKFVELSMKLKYICLNQQSTIRYAFYLPEMCEIPIDAYPVFSPLKKCQ